MDVRIGVTYATKELVLEMEGDADGVRQQVDQAAQADGSMLWLTDKRGTCVGIPLDKLAYVEIEGEGHKGRVGFGD